MDNDNVQRREFTQYVVVLRHGDRIDHFDPLWTSTAARPWDPPLIEAGLIRAFSTGKTLKSRLDFPIHRVFVSPFIRCIQTASEAVSGFCATDDGVAAADTSKIKVNIEYGLCETLTTQAIPSDVAPKDGDFRFNISELEALLPPGTVDHTVEPVYPEMPKWEETVTGSRTRYAQVFKALADKYPSENLLLVTHAEGVAVSVSAFKKDVTVYEVDYCAFSELKRTVLEEDHKYITGEFEVLTKSGETRIGYSSSAPTADGPE
ncbi:uncharacterized protein LOC130015657 [Mercurialis annua]|uniref:uncharacterized protein LOC130015657 n=1 Tax=Mercurialis annua TaxID=3986 RepID=UPI0024AD08A4|nr:uncharacterized protein LOC130015657 [Mercurialis annua]